MYLSAHPPQTVADLARLEPFGPFNKKTSVCSTWSLQLEATVIRQKVQHAKKKTLACTLATLFCAFSRKPGSNQTFVSSQQSKLSNSWDGRKTLHQTQAEGAE